MNDPTPDEKSESYAGEGRRGRWRVEGSPKIHMLPGPPQVTKWENGSNVQLFMSMVGSTSF